MTARIRKVLFVYSTLACGAALAAVIPPPSRFDRLVIEDPASLVGVVAEEPNGPDFAPLGEAWSRFREAHGGSWKVWLDRRSAVPLLVEGSGIRWFPPEGGASLAELESLARRFFASHEGLFGWSSSELVLDPAGSGAVDRHRFVLVFDRVVEGIPVEGERVVLHIVRGNLVSFGATRWGAIRGVPKVVHDATAALEIVRSYMGLEPGELFDVAEFGRLVFVPVPPEREAGSRYAGAPGLGIGHRLVWRLALTVPGERGTWVAKVDAVTGEIVAFYDADLYAVRGGVYPLSNDQDCGDLGCELPGFPMPYSDVTTAKQVTTSDDMGQFPCAKGPKNSSVKLSGPFVTVSDTCGTAVESGNCSRDLDFSFGPGTDCAVPSGHSSGDTHAGRTSFYHLNRLKEKARTWLPSNGWVNQKLTDRVNISNVCNAFWNGNVNFYRSGGGCRNTGEISGVVAHEYGHGLDQNDGGGYDNPSEAYADVIAILQDRRSCVGRGFFASGNCSGYGDPCLNCSGIRDMDFAAHASGTPATPANFTQVRCGGGGGPCGREVHCESYVPSEAVFDLAYRDLPASGMDPDSSWQLAEKLFYQSRQGSGGNAFNCALPFSDGCNVNGWFHTMRVADDEDGNLANGTPHAAAIFAAFARHGIACGQASDPSNQSSSTCPPLGAPAVSASAGPGAVSLSWTAVPGAARYLVLRGDISCASTQNVIATVEAPETSYVDDGLLPGFTVYYRVQAQGSNPACDGPVSACVPAAAQ